MRTETKQGMESCRYSGEAGLVNCRPDGQDQVPC